MLSPERFPNHLSNTSRRARPARVAWAAVATLVVIGLAGCDAGVTAPAPGSMVVAIETTGFLKAEGYDLTVDGVSSGAIGANEEMTISELEPGEYQVTLANVPENCTAEGVTVTVEAGQAADVSLVVTCSYADPVTYTIRFNNRRPDLDTEEILECSFGLCSDADNDRWDVYAENNSSTEPHSIIRYNQTIGVEIAHLPGVTLESLTEADYEGAVFTTDPVDDPFDVNRVILVRTDVGNVFALGNPIEDVESLTQTLTFDAALIATP